MFSIFVFCFSMVFYAYFGYPMALILLEKLRRRESHRSLSSGTPSLALVITVRNESAVIRKKLENTLALRYGEGTVESEAVPVIVASDASDDDTDDVVLSYANRGVVLIRSEERRGKEAAQANAVQSITSDVVCFTDAKTELAADALVNAVAYFNDSSVGSLSSIDQVVTADGSVSGESLYVRYEMWLRKLESKVLTLVGLSGSCFFVRRSICQNFRTDVPSDFALLLETRRQGLRGVLGPDVVCCYGALESQSAEFKRKVRTVLRGITTFFATVQLQMAHTDPLFFFQLVSHKLARWLVPWFSILALLALAFGAKTSILMSLLLVLALLFICLAAVAYKNPSLAARTEFKIPLFFCLTNAAIFAAWLKFISGQRSVHWTPSNR